MQNPLRRLKFYSAFTLIELLIAMFIFVILGLIVATGLRTALQAQQHLQKLDAVIQQAEIAMTLIQRDVVQMIDRPVLDNNGSSLPSMSFSGNALEFTRAGYSNPRGLEKRSEMLRVAYAVKNGKLVRMTWPVLDRAPNTKSTERAILDGVTGVTIQFVSIVNGQGQVSNSWLMMNGNYMDPNQRMPAGIIVTFTFASGGSLTRVFPIPGVGLVGDNNVYW